MPGTEIPDSAINAIARHINERSNKEFHIPVIGNESNLETPQVFEIILFDRIDNSKRRFYAIDGSYNSEQFTKKNLVDYWYEKWINPRIDKLQDKLESKLKPESNS